MKQNRQTHQLNVAHPGDLLAKLSIDPHIWHGTFNCSLITTICANLEYFYDDSVFGQGAHNFEVEVEAYLDYILEEVLVDNWVAVLVDIDYSCFEG